MAVSAYKKKENKRNPEKTFFLYVFFYHFFSGINNIFKGVFHHD